MSTPPSEQTVVIVRDATLFHPNLIDVRTIASVRLH